MFKKLVIASVIILLLPVATSHLKNLGHFGKNPRVQYCLFDTLIYILAHHIIFSTWLAGSHLLWTHNPLATAL